MPVHEINNTTNRYQSGATSQNVVTGLFIVFSLVVVAWATLPSSFSTDLDRIGQGKPAITLIYDMENGSSLNLMEGYNAIRHDYEHLIEFLVADVASPSGNTFIRAHEAMPGSAVYFSGTGEKIMVLYGPQDEKVLIDSIKKAFGV